MNSRKQHRLHVQAPIYDTVEVVLRRFGNLSAIVVDTGRGVLVNYVYGLPTSISVTASRLWQVQDQLQFKFQIAIMVRYIT